MAGLERLLDDRLVAIGPDRSQNTKDDDLAGYRSGSSVISELVKQDVEVLVVGAIGVTFFVGTVSGTFEGQPMTARLRYTCTWVHESLAGWRILATHIAVLTLCPDPVLEVRAARSALTYAYPDGPQMWRDRLPTAGPA